MVSIYKVDSAVIMTYSSAYDWQSGNDSVGNILKWVTQSQGEKLVGAAGIQILRYPNKCRDILGKVATRVDIRWPIQAECGIIDTTYYYLRYIWSRRL